MPIRTLRRLKEELLFFEFEEDVCVTVFKGEAAIASVVGMISVKEKVKRIRSMIGIQYFFI